MNQRHIRSSGFTLIELIVVIVVIGILAGITVLGFSRYQTDTRDARRAASANIIIENLEKYYDANGEYPSCTALSVAASTVGSTTLKGIDLKALVAPQAIASEDNSIKCSSSGNVLTTNGSDFFEYIGDNSVACNGSGSCLKFSLKYKKQSTDELITINSRRNTLLSTSGAPTLVSTGKSFTTIDVSWNTVQNALSYDIQYSTNAAFTASLVSDTGLSGTTYTATGLTYNTSYYFRVRAQTTDSTGLWSNVIIVMTNQLDAPLPSATPNTFTQITVSWPVVTNATNYIVQMDTSNAFNPGTRTEWSSPSLSRAATGLTTNTTYYFRVMATNGAIQGPWSSTISAVPIIQPAPAYNISAYDNAGTWTATANSTCPGGASTRYDWYANGAAWVNGPSYRTVGYYLNYGQGITLTVRVQCYIGSADSVWTNASNSAGYTRPVPAPTWTRLQYINSSGQDRSWIEFTNVCGGPNEILSVQGGYNSGWNAPLWNGSSPYGGGRSYNNYWLSESADYFSYANTTHYVRTTCNGIQSPQSAGGTVVFP
jgi:prepilin-type N-terminal cleavage/methylation domain-containing protein